ncbi:MAG: adenylate/guanylate cyclase domain-containing protein [Euzebya sp.]
MAPLINHLSQLLRVLLADIPGGPDLGPDEVVLGLVAAGAVHFVDHPRGDCWAQVVRAVRSGEIVTDDRFVVLPLPVHDATDQAGDDMAGVVVWPAERAPEPGMLRLIGSRLSAEVSAARRQVRLQTLLRDYASSPVAEDLVTVQADGTVGTIRDLTVLFADVRGFTSFTERTASEVVVSYLNQLLQPAIVLVQDHGGTVSNFMGDAMMAVFGAAGDQPDHAYLAAKAALALTTTLSDANPALPRFGVGVNTGPAFVGNVGGPHRRVFTIIGDTVNLAARLEARTPPGSVLIGAETYRSIRPLATVDALDPFTVKGKEHPVRAYRLRSLAAASATEDTVEIAVQSS